MLHLHLRLSIQFPFAMEVVQEPSSKKVLLQKNMLQV